MARTPDDGRKAVYGSTKRFAEVENRPGSRTTIIHQPDKPKRDRRGKWIELVDTRLHGRDHILWKLQNFEKLSNSGNYEYTPEEAREKVIKPLLAQIYRMQYMFDHRGKPPPARGVDYGTLDALGTLLYDLAED